MVVAGIRGAGIDLNKRHRHVFCDYVILNFVDEYLMNFDEVVVVDPSKHATFLLRIRPWTAFHGEEAWSGQLLESNSDLAAQVDAEGGFLVGFPRRPVGYRNLI